MAPACPLVIRVSKYEVMSQITPVTKHWFSMLQQENVGYLSVEQALADHAVLIDHIKVTCETPHNILFIINLYFSYPSKVQIPARS